MGGIEIMREYAFYDSRLKPIRACALMWGISRTGICIGKMLM